MKHYILAGSVVALMLASVPVFSQQKPLMGMDKSQFDEAVKDYIMKNPTVILDSINKFIEQEKNKSAAETDASFYENEKELLTLNPFVPVLGNKDAKITILYVLDANCGFCRRMTPIFEELVKNNPDVRVIHRYASFLAPSSEYSARAAGIIWKRFPDKYPLFYKELMTLNRTLTNDIVDEVAEKIIGQSSLSIMKAEMGANNDALNDSVATMVEIAHRAQITGTPFMYVQDAGKEGILRGAVPLEKIQSIIIAMRAKK